MARRRGFAGTAVLAVLLAGCGQPAGPLRVVVPNAPLSLDPHLQDEESSHAALGNVFEALTSFDAEMRLQPGLAIRWESPDDLTWRLQLRPGVRFHDGRQLGVEDVVASLERARHHPRSGVSGYLVAIRQVRGAGAATVEIVTSRPYPLLLHKLAFVYVAPAASPDEIRQPIGTGPYRLVAFGSEKVLELEAFPGYWGHRPALPRVAYLPVERPAERVRMLGAGEADVVASIPIDDTPPPTPGFHFETRSGLSVVHLGLRTDRPPFSDVRVRRAIHLALDRQAVIDRLLGGRAEVASQPLGPQVFGFEPALPVPVRDLERARALLAEVGLGGGFDVALEHQTGSSRHVAMIRDQLAEAGIRVTTVAHAFADLYPRLVRGDVRFYLAGVSCSTGDASDLLDDALHGRDEARGYGDANFTGYRNPRLDELIERSGQTLDTAQRRGLLQAAMRLAMDDLPLLPLWNRPLVYGVRDGIVWTPRRDGRPYARDIRRAP